MQTKASFYGIITEREKKNQALAFEAAAEGIVLLENDGTLPLKPGRLALFGAGAAYTIQGGSGSGEVNVRHAANALEGLENAGFTVTTKDWIDRYDAEWKRGKEAFVRENRKKLRKLSTKLLAALMAAEYRYPSGDAITEREIEASGADTCIYILSRQSGEGHDRKDEAGSFRLTETEIANIRLCAGLYERFVLVLNTGAVIDLSPLDEIEGINALVYMNQLGMEGGNALAAVLTGLRTPSGKLAVTTNSVNPAAIPRATKRASTWAIGTSTASASSLAIPSDTAKAIRILRLKQRLSNWSGRRYSFPLRSRTPVLSAGKRSYRFMSAARRSDRPGSISASPPSVRRGCSPPEKAKR